eukprot:TRINITY_DN8410_c0_g2_i4.p1 TRINITY_DN8410_c0_g2~~TRINITY_DN8410_c0_g2_i4.p1  ORF type:complete len:420 (+),score=58.48 TRINITY_DN8410_c0_g2_i4:66-1325(+)
MCIRDSMTGDAAPTAIAVAKELGLLESGKRKSAILEGSRFYQQIGGIICRVCLADICLCRTSERLRRNIIGDQDQFNEVSADLVILARTKPSHKEALVLGLQEAAHTVAVAGNGANDAAAMRRADVGIAMGKEGTEIAREAADLILLEDKLDSLAHTIVLGRNIYQSVRKFLQFQLTMTISTIVLEFLGALLYRQPIFASIQLLWVNLTIDILASVAFATEPPDDDLLWAKPVRRDEYIITKKMMAFIMFHGITLSAVALALTCFGENFLPEYGPDLLGDNFESVRYNGQTDYVRSGRTKFLFSNEDDYGHLIDNFGPSRHYTIVFTSFTFMMHATLINSRSIDLRLNVFRGITRNWLFIVIVIGLFLSQFLIVTIGQPFHCHREGLHWIQWVICVLFGISILIAWSCLLYTSPSPRDS